jgi:transcriptional regulator with XRE-family HTH domain
MTTKQTVPNMLRFYRKQAGLRQIDVAARLGFMNTDRISHWEKGSAFPNVTNLFKLSAIYKVPAQELYGEYCKTIGTRLAQTPAGLMQQETALETSTVPKPL